MRFSANPPTNTRSNPKSNPLLSNAFEIGSDSFFSGATVSVKLRSTFTNLSSLIEFTGVVLSATSTFIVSVIEVGA